VSLTSVVAPSPESARHQLGGYSFVKVVVGRENSVIRFRNDARHSFHAIHIGEEILGGPGERVRAGRDHVHIVQLRSYSA